MRRKGNACRKRQDIARGEKVEARRFLALDGLRGVAALSILLFHRRWWVAGGHFLDHAWLAVDFFFLLSGFVLDHAYAQRLRADMHRGRFLLLRLIRLYPMTFAGAAIGVLLPLIRAVHNSVFDFRLPLVALVNAMALPAPAAISAEPFAINQPVWSLFFELVASGAFAITLARLSTRALAVAAAIAGAITIIVVAHFSTLAVGNHRNDLPWGLVRVATPFIIGMLLHRLREAVRWPAIPFWAAAALLVASFLPVSGAWWDGAYSCIMVLIAYPLLLLGTQAREPDPQWLGVIRTGAFLSYPVYALHFPILALIDPIQRRLPMPGPLWLALAATIVVLIAAPLARWYDAPFRRHLRTWLAEKSAMQDGIG
jgi:peptidoglycan/LPS O-acetylase OafA/YrhL